ncbi:MAG: NUDIX hydrolase [Pyrinomonadaceae bacterium]
MTKSENGLDLQPWHVVRRERLVDASPWMQVWKETVRLPDGRQIDDFYTVDQPDHIMVFAVTGDDQVIGLWHYKHGSRNVNLSFPAGYVSPNEPPQDAARRELLEETGYQADDWISLGVFTVDGNRGNGRAHYFLARGALFGPRRAKGGRARFGRSGGDPPAIDPGQRDRGDLGPGRDYAGCGCLDRYCNIELERLTVER